jgi:hypothetical protein
LRVKLARLDADTKRSRINTERFMAEIYNTLITLLVEREHAADVWHLFVMTCPCRDARQQYLAEN